MWQDKDLFRDYFVNTYREGEPMGFYTRWYLFIYRRTLYGKDERVTSFRIESQFPPIGGPILIKYQGQWDTWASLIVEYVVNDLKINEIYLDEEYNGN